MRYDLRHLRVIGGEPIGRAIGITDLLLRESQGAPRNVLLHRVIRWLRAESWAAAGPRVPLRRGAAKP